MPLSNSFSPIPIHSYPAPAFNLAFPPRFKPPSRHTPLITVHRPPTLTLSLTLPPSAALLALTAASTHPFIPPPLRGPPTSFLLSALLSNLTLLPPTAPIYTFLIHNAPTAITLLLLQPPPPPPSPLPHPHPPLRTLLLSFIPAAIGTSLGALLVSISYLLPPHLRFHLAAAFAATYIGGSVNYIAIVNLLNIPADLAAAGLAADLILMAVYFAALFALAAPLRTHPSRHTPQTSPVTSTKPHPAVSSSVLLLLLPILLTIAVTVMARAVAALARLPQGFDLLLMSVAAVMLSRVGWLRERLSFSASLGNVVVTAFFAALGATTRLSAVLGASPAVVIMAAVVLAVHALSVFLVGKCVMRLPTRELLIASNANVGGSSTAAAFAAAVGWPDLIPGAVVVGSLGYLIGTPVGLAIFAFCQRFL